MLTNEAYISAALALHRAGEWDAALALLGQAGTEAAKPRAQILAERFFWQPDHAAAAEAAVDALDPTSVLGRYLGAQLAYARVLFDRSPRTGDVETADAGFRTAAEDPSMSGWGLFWLGLVADNVHEQPTIGRQRYEQALAVSQQDGDLLLESYVVRHLGGHILEHDQPAGIELLRRSLHLRAALGARPQVAGAQATLAGFLPDGPERDVLRQAALATANELGLVGLVQELTQD